MELEKILLNPLSSLLVVVVTIGQLAFGLIEPGWSLLSSTAELWFPALATAGATILPEIGLADLGTKLLLAAAVVYFAVKVNQLIDRLETWNSQR